MKYRTGGILCLILALILTPFAWNFIANSSLVGSDWIAQSFGAILPATLAWIGAIVMLSHKGK